MNLIEAHTDSTTDVLIKMVGELHALGLTWDYLSRDVFGYKHESSMKSICNGNSPSKPGVDRVLDGLMRLSQDGILNLHRLVIDATKWRLVPQYDPVKPKGSVKEDIIKAMKAIIDADAALKNHDAERVEGCLKVLEAFCAQLQSEKCALQNVYFSQEV